MRYLFFLLIMVFALNSWALEIKSSAFKDGEYIPKQYTCDSEDISPPLTFADIPKGTKSLVLICDDPDAPVGVWVHWVVFNIPADQGSFDQDLPKKGKLESGLIQGRNDFKKIGYGGPCPPKGKPHRYFFKLYAIDKKLNLKEGATKREVLQTIEGSIIDQAQLIGLYKR